jgi:D-alanyl-D-alanine carboxypeptidase
MGPWTADRYYAQGIVYINGWLVQTPSFAGLYGIAAYYPPKDIALTVWCTKSIAAGTDYNNTAQTLAVELSKILVPDNPM